MVNICRMVDFGPVNGFEMGHGLIGRPYMSVYFYLIDDTLIDTGQPLMKSYFVDLIKSLSISQVLLTHFHEDHSGNAAIIKKMKRLPIYGHPLTAAKLEQGFAILPFQYAMWGKAKPVQIEPLPPAILTARHKLIPIHTPGHSKDHTVYLENDEGWLFSGDLFLAPEIKYFRADERFIDTVKSLYKVLELDFQTLFCSHRPTLTNGKAMILRKLDYFQNLFGEISAFLEKGYSDSEILRYYHKREVTSVKISTCGNVSLNNMIHEIIKAVRTEPDLFRSRYH